MRTFHTNNSEETIAFGKKVGNLLLPNDVILLAGDLGAGKTTFTKGIGIALDIKRVINSPTFTIVKEYHGKYDLYHLDLYRLDGLGDDFDLEEYFTSNGICVCEWPYNVEEIIPSEYLRIDIYREEADKRRFELTPIGDRYIEIVRDLNA